MSDTSDSAKLLRRLERICQNYGGDAAARKRELLRSLERRRLPSAEHVLRLHECLCFLHAYPDDAATLARVERGLRGFERRADLRAHRDALADSGVAGTPIRFSFYLEMARWLAEHWPRSLSIDWSEFERAERVGQLIGLLATPSEMPATDEFAYSPREWVELLKGPRETDASFLIRRFADIPADGFWRERLFEELDTPLVLQPGRGTPNRTLARHAVRRVQFQTESLSRARPKVEAELRRPPRSVRAVSPVAGEKLIDLAREAMVTRSRDLDVFAYADRRDVRLVDCGDGLQFACFGMQPERRLLLEAVYGFLTLKNGVPIGYVLASALFNSSEIAYNVFDTYRGAEAGRIYGRVLSMVHHLLGSDSFSIDPYQLGHHNAEGLASGAWWFYYKFGFRPLDDDVRRVLRGELRRMRADPGHRSSRATLRRLVTAYLYWHAGRPRADVLGRFALGNVGLQISRYLARRFGGQRSAGLRTCAREAAELLGRGSARGLSAAERIAWERWSPLVLILPGVRDWSAADRRALARVVRAKGGRRESDFVARFNRHAPLRRALLRLSRRG